MAAEARLVVPAALPVAAYAKDGEKPRARDAGRLQQAAGACARAGQCGPHSQRGVLPWREQQAR